MKLTPEQKAFYEYGKAREALRLFKTDFAYREDSFEYGFEKGRLRMAIDTIRRRAWERHGARYGEVVFPVRELVWNEFNIKGIIACVRQKRAACKAWNPPDGRDCPNCFYSRNRRCKLPCSQCWGHCLWEPRKEGK